MNLDDRTGGAMSLWEQTRTHRWVLVAGLVIGIVIGATVAILFRPLIYAIVLILLALLAFRFLRSLNRRGNDAPSAPAVRGMVITGRYAEPGSASRADRFEVPDKQEPAAPPEPAPREVRRGPEYDAEIDAILANIDRQIGEEAARQPRQPAPRRPVTASEPDEPRDAEFRDR